mgnify:CR=1 FL=1
MEEKDWRIVRALADGIPITYCPYAVLAKKAGMREEEFLARLRELKKRRILRRVGAVLQHRRAGFLANALCVWSVPKERLDEVGTVVSREEAVSHCYLRAPIAGWPYNFYVMLHAHDRETCEKLADRIAQECNLGERKTFYSVREWKKASMRYLGENQ